MSAWIRHQLGLAASMEACASILAACSSNDIPAVRGCEGNRSCPPDQVCGLDHTTCEPLLDGRVIGRITCRPVAFGSSDETIGATDVIALYRGASRLERTCPVYAVRRADAGRDHRGSVLQLEQPWPVHSRLRERRKQRQCHGHARPERGQGRPAAGTHPQVQRLDGCGRCVDFVGQTHCQRAPRRRGDDIGRCGRAAGLAVATKPRVGGQGLAQRRATALAADLALERFPGAV